MRCLIVAKSEAEVHHGTLSTSTPSLLVFEISGSAQGHAGPLQVVEALDTSQTIAVTQQLIAFAALAGGEGVWANQNVRASIPGRPNLPVTGACAAVMLLVSPLSCKTRNILFLLLNVYSLSML